MAFLQYEGVGIAAMSAAVPKRVIVNREYTDVFSKEEANEIVEKNIMNRSEDPKDYIESFRSSVYIRPGQFQFFKSKFGINK